MLERVLKRVGRRIFVRVQYAGAVGRFESDGLVWCCTGAVDLLHRKVGLATTFA